MRRYKNIKAQSTIEFSFAMIVVMFLIYGMIQVFRWAGMDLAQRRWAQESTMTNLIGTDPNSELDTDADIYYPMDAVFHGKITDGNISR